MVKASVSSVPHPAPHRPQNQGAIGGGSAKSGLIESSIGDGQDEGLVVIKMINTAVTYDGDLGLGQPLGAVALFQSVKHFLEIWIG